MADLGIKEFQSYCSYCRSTLLIDEEKVQGHHNTCKYEISQYKEDKGYWYYLQMVGADFTDCFTDSKGRIIHLNLAGKDLADLPELPFKDIEVLDLSGNILDRIPKWIFKLTHLKEIFFPGNGFSQTLMLDMLKLNEKGVNVISTGLKFENYILKEVNLAYIGSFMLENPLNISEDITNYFTTAKKVNISYNNLYELPEWIFKIKRLEELNIAGNNLAAEEYLKLMTIKKLKKLDISQSYLENEYKLELNKLRNKGIIISYYSSRFL